VLHSRTGSTPGEGFGEPRSFCFRTDAATNAWAPPMPAQPRMRVSTHTPRRTCSSPIPRPRKRQSEVFVGRAVRPDSAASGEPLLAIGPQPPQVVLIRPPSMT
jgi:hypothetical protein